MDDITRKAMTRIRGEGIAPEPKYIARLRGWALWAPVVISVLFGSFALAVIFYVFYNSDFIALGRMGGGFIFRAMPYFWIVSLAFFLLLGEYTYGKTLFGHRYHVLKVALAYIFITGAVGVSFVYLGIPKYLQETMRGNSAIHDVLFSHEAVWTDPVGGLLAGTIESVSSSTLLVRDFNDKLWTIDYSLAAVRGRVVLIPGEQIKMIGEVRTDGFIANEIRPGFGGMMGQKRMMR